MSLLRRPFSTPSVTAIHLFLVSSFFAPFFFAGRVLMPSTDWLDFEFPLVMLARQNLRAGHLGLWNPFVLCGAPVTSSALFHVFYPETWLLIGVPDEYFFYAVTLLCFLKMAALGVFSYLLFREETGSEKWSFLASIVYAMGGYAIWSITTNAISLSLWFTVGLWLAWSEAKRDRVKNYLLFTLVFVLMGSCANLLEERYAAGIVLLLGIWRMRRACLPLVGGLVTSLLLSAPRWLPAAAEILSSNRVGTGAQPGFSELGVLIVRLFDPEVFGISYWSSFHVLRALSTTISHSYVHIHTHMPHYFGVLPALLVTAMIFKKDAASRSWKVIFLVALALVLELEPLTTFARFALGFLYHPRCFHILLPVSFCMLLAHWKGGVSAGLRWTLGIIALYLVVIWLMLLQYKFDARALLAMGVVAAGIVAWVYRPSVVIGATVLACAVGAAFAQDSPYTRTLVTSVAALLIIGVILPMAPERYRRILVAGTALLCLVTFWSPRAPTAVQLPGIPVILAISLIGAARLGVVSAVLLGRGALFPLCLALTAIDMVGAARVHADMVLNAFLVEKNPYPPLDRKLPDFTLYRATTPNLLAASPAYRRIHGNVEELSSFHVAYGVPSYGGYVSSVPPSYSRFLEGLVPAKELYGDYPVKNGLISNMKDRRALQLVGVGEGAVARFQMFKRYEVVKDVMARLRAPDFSPLGSLVLDAPVGIASAEGASVALRPLAHSSDDLEIAVGDTAPGVLLFNDTFHRGWHALIDGEPASIVRANGNFMGIAVPAGARRVSLTFEPPLFGLSLRLVLLGLAFLVIPFALRTRWSVKFPRALTDQP